MWQGDAPPRVQPQVEWQERVWQGAAPRAYASECSDWETLQDAEFPEAVGKEGLCKERLTALVA